MFWWEMALLSSAVNCDALLGNLTIEWKEKAKTRLLSVVAVRNICQYNHLEDAH